MAKQRLVTSELVARVRAIVDAMTPEQYRAMIDAQRESFIRAMAPCEHGDPDWETCPQCLAKYAPSPALQAAIDKTCARIEAVFKDPKLKDDHHG